MKIQVKGVLLSVGEIKTGTTVTKEKFEIANVEVNTGSNENVIFQAVNKQLTDITSKNIGDIVEVECDWTSKFSKGYPNHSIIAA